MTSRFFELIVGLTFVGCASSSSPTSPASSEPALASSCNTAPQPAPNAAEIQRTIFGVSCGKSSSCHSGVGHQADLDLSTLEASCTSLKKASCQFPDVPRSKRLIDKVTCTGEACEGTPSASCSSRGNMRMPLGGDPLDPCLIDALRTWIDAGMTGCP